MSVLFTTSFSIPRILVGEGQCRQRDTWQALMLGLRHSMVVTGNGSWPIVLIGVHSDVMQGSEVIVGTGDVIF